MAANEVELLIEDYLEGRLQGPARAQFEARLKADSALRGKVQATTTSIHLVREVLAKVEPGEDFEDKVSSKIIVITETNPRLKAARRAAPSDGPLTANDPDAKLFSDPQAARERRRLLVVAMVAGALFIAAMAVLWFVFR